MKNAHITHELIHFSVLKFLFGFSLILFLFIEFSACNSDDVKGNLYTFTDKLLGQYIENDTTLSEFNKLLDKTKVKGLLNSYGAYSCFAPSNNAMRQFYKLKGKKSLDEFSADSLKLMAYDHLINGAIVEYAQFQIGRLSNLTMSDRYISISFSDSGTYVNKLSKITQKDILVHNGVIHKIDRVLDPVRFGVAEVISKDSIFSIFYNGLVATGLVDSLLRTVDKNYSLSAVDAQILEDAVNTTVASERHAPISRRFGYTLLMESNQTMKAHGIINLQSLKKYASDIYDKVYPADAGITDITNRSNSLNRFIAYHIINKELSYSKFILDYYSQHMSRIVDMYEYIEPMCPNTLIEVKYEAMSGQANHFNTIRETGDYVGIVMTNYDNDSENGVYHEVDNMLVYSSNVDAEMSTKRLRFDFASLFPELTNNNMRGRPSDNNVLYRNALPPGYLDRLQCTDATVICYSNANDKLMDFEGDEIFITVQNGQLYNFTATTPPVPAGTYEVRFGYQSNGKRGVAQFYIDGIPTDVPINLNTLGTDIGIGYVLPGNDSADPFGYENDKMMRNRGYMKGPNSFKSVDLSWYTGQSARYNSSNLRKIVGTYTFSKAGNHTISVKGLSGGQFQIDFIEFVPTSLLESEDIN